MSANNYIYLEHSLSGQFSVEMCDMDSGPGLGKKTHYKTLQEALDQCAYLAPQCEYGVMLGRRINAKGEKMTKPNAAKVEELSSKFHDIYQEEARRQAGLGVDEVRHPDKYEDLPERTKEYDRVLARYVLAWHNERLQDMGEKIKKEAIAELKKDFAVREKYDVEEWKGGYRIATIVHQEIIDQAIQQEVGK